MQTVTGTLRALHDHVIVSDMNFGERISKGGIVLLGDNAKDTGIRPRWGKVYVVGTDQTEVKVGQWVLIEHGRWTRGIKVVQPDGTTKVVSRVDNDYILAVSDTDPEHDDTIR